MAGLEGCGVFVLVPMCAKETAHAYGNSAVPEVLLLDVCLHLGVCCMTAMSSDLRNLPAARDCTVEGFEIYSPPDSPGPGMCLHRSALQV